MTAEEYWKALCQKNPVFSEKEVVSIKVNKLQAIVKQAHAKGVEFNKSTHDNDSRKKENFFDLFFNNKRN